MAAKRERKGQCFNRVGDYVERRDKSIVVNNPTHLNTNLDRELFSLLSWCFHTPPFFRFFMFKILRISPKRVFLGDGDVLCGLRSVGWQGSSHREAAGCVENGRNEQVLDLSCVSVCPCVVCVSVMCCCLPVSRFRVWVGLGEIDVIFQNRFFQKKK